MDRFENEVLNSEELLQLPVVAHLQAADGPGMSQEGRMHMMDLLGLNTQLKANKKKMEKEKLKWQQDKKAGRGGGKKKAFVVALPTVKREVLLKHMHNMILEKGTPTLQTAKSCSNPSCKVSPCCSQATAAHTTSTACAHISSLSIYLSLSLSLSLSQMPTLILV